MFFQDFLDRLIKPKKNRSAKAILREALRKISPTQWAHFIEFDPELNEMWLDFMISKPEIQSFDPCKWVLALCPDDIYRFDWINLVADSLLELQKPDRIEEIDWPEPIYTSIKLPEQAVVWAGTWIDNPDDYAQTVIGSWGSQLDYTRMENRNIILRCSPVERLSQLQRRLSIRFLSSGYYGRCMEYFNQEDVEHWIMFLYSLDLITEAELIQLQAELNGPMMGEMMPLHRPHHHKKVRGRRNVRRERMQKFGPSQSYARWLQQQEDQRLGLI